MIITSATLQALRTSLGMSYQKGFDGAETNHEAFTMTVPSTSATTTYGWLGAFPGVREWLSDRIINDLKEHGYVIVNKDWEVTIGVKGTDINDDNLGIYTPMSEEMGRTMKMHPGELVWNLLAAGDSTVCYDGQYFFDTDHPINANHDGSGADSTVSNITAGAGDPWILMDCSRAIKPIIYQERKKPVFTAMDDPKDESVFMKNEFRYGADSRGNVGFGLWQLAHMSKQTLDEANFKAARAAMRDLTKDGGKPLGIKPTHLVVGKSNIDAADALINKAKLANGEDNTLYKKIEIVESDYLP